MCCRRILCFAGGGWFYKVSDTIATNEIPARGAGGLKDDNARVWTNLGGRMEPLMFAFDRPWRLCKTGLTLLALS